MSWHIGRSWSAAALEDACPCPKEPCGLVDTDRAVIDCPHHWPGLTRTVRQMHPPEQCPGERQPAPRIDASKLGLS